MIKHKNKNDYGEKLKNIKNKISKFGDKLLNPDNFDFKSIPSNSWFNIDISKQDKLIKLNTDNIKSDKIDNDGYSTNRIELFLTDNQKIIINKWLDAYILMYNKTYKYFKSCIANNTKPIMTIKDLKALLSDDKKKIITETTFVLNKKKIKTDSHLLDYAINDALNRYESILSNYRARNIKSFRLRYLKLNKDKKIFKIEKSPFRQNTFYPKNLGKTIKCSINNYNYLDNIETVATLQYIKSKDKYYLLIKKQAKKTDNERKNIISIDPGIRTFLTGYSNNHTIKIGTNCQEHIRKKLKTIDKIRNRKPNMLIKKKGEILISKTHMTEYRKLKIIKNKYNKLNNQIIDMQWKVSKYLTENYKTILIGNFSTKKMGEDKRMYKLTKRIGNALNMFKFKFKLSYMCLKTNTGYKLVDESYSSKCCSNCGNYKKDLGTAKIYECKTCKITQDRDINGAKNILILGL